MELILPTYSFTSVEVYDIYKLTCAPLILGGGAYMLWSRFYN